MSLKIPAVCCDTSQVNKQKWQRVAVSDVTCVGSDVISKNLIMHVFITTAVEMSFLQCCDIVQVTEEIEIATTRNVPSRKR